MKPRCYNVYYLQSVNIIFNVNGQIEQYLIYVNYMATYAKKEPIYKHYSY